jgi:hypothetical protein
MSQRECQGPVGRRDARQNPGRDAGIGHGEHRDTAARTGSSRSTARTCRHARRKVESERRASSASGARTENSEELGAVATANARARGEQQARPSSRGSLRRGT